MRNELERGEDRARRTGGYRDGHIGGNSVKKRRRAPAGLPPRSTAPPGGGTLERVALAPDWLFGRGCLTHVRAPENLLAAAGADAGGASCRAPERTPGLATLAPGPSAGMLVATHFVYSMALKRKRAFRAFGWDFGDGRNRSTTAAYNGAAGSCWKRNDRAILLGHTFFTQTEGTKAVRLPRDSFGAIRRDAARRGARLLIARSLSLLIRLCARFPRAATRRRPSARAAPVSRRSRSCAHARRASRSRARAAAASATRRFAPSTGATTTSCSGISGGLERVPRPVAVAS